MRCITILLLFGIIVASPVMAAQLSAKGTSPDMGDTTGSCVNPVLRPLSSAQWIHLRAVRIAREDSVLVPGPNWPWIITFVGVQPDTYATRCWSSIAALPQFVGCDTVAVLFTGFKPWKPKLTP